MQTTKRREVTAKAVNPDQIANWNRVLFNACLRRTQACGASDQFEEALQWAAVAAWFASRKGCFGELSSRELEAELLRAGHSLPVPPRTSRAHSRPRWLHVLTEAYGTLGHSNLCRRWIQYDSEVTHDVMLLDQRSGTPANLVAAVKAAGGECFVLDRMTPLLERAMELRIRAWQNADVVVLHTHPEEVIATTAFGVEGGPPVLLVNHADHAFWVGCSVADLVLDIRTSGHLWTKQARGVDRAIILPLPLANREFEGAAALPDLKQQQQKLRMELGIPKDAILLLTVGSAAKYEPLPGMNFVDAAVRILEECPNARLIAVGPEDEGDWKAARRRTGGRFRAVGRQPDSALFCQAADVYLEGFPSGSLTALLEAGMAGLACVRSPRNCIPPFASDGVGVDEVAQPGGIDEYVRTAVALAQDAQARTELGQKLQRTIISYHCGAGWLTQLRELKEQMPERHRTYPNFYPTQIERHRRNWPIQLMYAQAAAVNMSTVAAHVFVEAWKRSSGEPQVDETLWRELRACEPDIDPSIQFLKDSRNVFSLWQLNRRIRRRGIRGRFIAHATQALANGKQALARKLTYACLLRAFSSMGDMAWLKLLVKTHLNQKWVRQMKRVKKSPY